MAGKKMSDLGLHAIIEMLSTKIDHLENKIASIEQNTSVSDHALRILTRSPGTFEPVFSKQIQINKKLHLDNFGQKTIFVGPGSLLLGSNVNFGVATTSKFLFGHIYIEIRDKNSTISIGSRVHVGNNCVMLAMGSCINIGDNTLIGVGVEITDNDGHFLEPHRRNEPGSVTKAVNIGQNVLIGNHVRILKGVRIGDNSVIGDSSVVTKNVPDNVVFAGNPAKFIRRLM